MKIGIVSDTHDNLELARKASHFLEEKVEKVVHCGDMVSPFTAEIFDKDFDFYYVKGNNDGEWSLENTVEEFGEFLGNSGKLEFQEADIGVYHGTEEEIVSSMVESDRYDYVFRGHTHEIKLEEVGGTVEVNPGGIPIPSAEEEFHIAILDLETGEVEFHKVRED